MEKMPAMIDGAIGAINIPSSAKVPMIKRSRCSMIGINTLSNSGSTAKLVVSGQRRAHRLQVASQPAKSRWIAHQRAD